MKRTFLFAMFAAALALAGCDNSAPSGPSAQASATAPAGLSDELLKSVNGFEVGQRMSARTVYVFFDAQCPHCGTLWEAAKPLENSARFVWVPVSVLNKASHAQGATILAAADPAATMVEHEKSLLARSGGITADSDAIKSHGDKMEANTKLFQSTGATSIPFIVYKHPQTGSFVKQEGAMETLQLKAFLGL
jgi:thiol:disulfide interchange protein DsbG